MVLSDLIVSANEDYEFRLSWRSLEDGESRPITSHGRGASLIVLDSSDRWMATAGLDGLVRVGPVSGEEPHLLLGHRGAIWALAVSPDGRWIASGGDDGTVRLWPTPDLSRPPLHNLPHDQLIAELKSLTNLRIVEDPESSSGWTLGYDPFRGWQEVPEW